MVVCILGCGPAGLFAAQAVDIEGHEPVIISKKQKSEIRGAQFLHKPIPGLSTGTQENIAIHRIGYERNYAARVYGDENVKTSWSLLPETMPAWDLREAYDAAWDTFGSAIMDQSVDAETVSELTANFQLVISTIPLWTICTGEHKFLSRSILVSHSEVPRSAFTPNYVIYNGEPLSHWSDKWYRRSRIFGHKSTELMMDPQVVDQTRGGLEAGYKVVDTDCDCHPNVVRAGRHGTWQRGVLTHHAFDTALDAIYEHIA